MKKEKTDDPVSVAVSVRAIVEFALQSGDLTPGLALSRMREGTLAHKTRQRASPDSNAEVTVRKTVEGEMARLQITGRIDLLGSRDGLPVVEEIKLAPTGAPPKEAAPAHRAQAVCYGHMLDRGAAVIRIVYARRDGEEAASFEETLSENALRREFDSLVSVYLAMIEQRLRWRALRNASIGALGFPFEGYRAGQREMAVQVYWAIRTGKRLFAEAPTGIGKTAAALFPALKALGEGLTGQLFYLTARTTAQNNATAAIRRMRGDGVRLRTLSLTAKEKICPYASSGAFVCDMVGCPSAIGFFDRLPDGLADMRGTDDWSRDAVCEAAARHNLCPFEFSLSLCEEADAVICDYNYAFDPAVRLRRIFLWTKNVTLLIDEAHNLPDRARAMLSAEVDSGPIREARRSASRALGRKTPLYKALTALIRWLEKRPAGVDAAPPEGLAALLNEALDEAIPSLDVIPISDMTRALFAAAAALDRFDKEYATHTEGDEKHRRVTLRCLDPAPHIGETTAKLHGSIFFSATLTPLSAWRDVLGGDGEDGLLSLPSPFPRENLLVLRSSISTKYRARGRTAPQVAEAIVAAVSARAGNYLACFPSYMYLHDVQNEIEKSGADITLHLQRSRMTDEERAEYLAAFAPRESGVLLGMVVMGGVFGEGVDLPGDMLSGVCVVGVGLPQVCAERELLRSYYAAALGNGFAHAYRYPGMNKVLQAVGRVIRTETDRGVALLIDDRFSLAEYAELMPVWWGEAGVVRGVEGIRARTQAFWAEGPS